MCYPHRGRDPSPSSAFNTLCSAAAFRRRPGDGTPGQLPAPTALDKGHTCLTARSLS